MSLKKTKPKNESTSDYHVVGYVFLAVAFGMFWSEVTRATAIAFCVIGITFILIEQDNKKKKSTKD